MWLPWGRSEMQKRSCFLHVGICRTRQSRLFPFWNEPSCQFRPGFGNGAQITGLGEEDEGYDFIKNPKTAVTGQSSLILGDHRAVRTKLPGPVCFPFSRVCVFLPCSRPQPGASIRGGLPQTLPPRPRSRSRFGLCRWFCSYSCFQFLQLLGFPGAPSSLPKIPLCLPLPHAPTWPLL